MIHNKDDEFMGFKAVTEPKLFGKFKTIIWKRKDEKGYFVTVYDSETERLTNVKYCINGNKISFTDTWFMTYIYDDGLNNQPNLCDLTVPANAHKNWQPYFLTIYQQSEAFFTLTPHDWPVWSAEGTCFIIGMHLENYYDNYKEDESWTWMA